VTIAIWLGIADPTDLFAYDEIARLLRREIELAVVLESYVLQVIDRTYRHTEKISSLAQELGQELGDSVVDFATMGTGQTAEEAQEAFQRAQNGANLSPELAQFVDQRLKQIRQRLR